MEFPQVAESLYNCALRAHILKGMMTLKVPQGTVGYKPVLKEPGDPDRRARFSSTTSSCRGRWSNNRQSGHEKSERIELSPGSSQSLPERAGPNRSLWPSCSHALFPFCFLSWDQMTQDASPDATAMLWTSKIQINFYCLLIAQFLVLCLSHSK